MVSGSPCGATDNKMSNVFIDNSIYFSLKVIDFILNIVYSCLFFVFHAIKLTLHYIFGWNMIETSKKRNKNIPESSTQTVAVRGLINANWQKLLSSNLIADTKEDRPLPKDHFTGTFRRARKKKTKNEPSNSVQSDFKVLNLEQSIEGLVTNGELSNREVTKNSSKNKLTKFLAMDCEMVGIGYEGADHMLARISIVNKFGDCVYDKFVKPREEVKDYRTEVSGIRKEDLLNAEDFMVVQKEVSELLRGRILVGHSLKNDLGVLFLSHPKRSIRDTSRYKPFRKVSFKKIYFYCFFIIVYRL